MDVHLLILNYNGRRLLAECLPSVLRAAENSRLRCDVAVVDNDSADGSVAWLAKDFPRVRVIRQPNRGLCSFNVVVPVLEGPVAVLLNNDIRLDPHCIDPLVAPLLETPGCFMTAPLCWRADGRTYEGFRTAVRWRFGLIEATAFFPGHEAAIRRPGLTASAGAALAVDCRKFAELGGFDPLYLPGRLEDLDFAFRAFQAGYHARYVPEAVAYHLGMATFGPIFGRAGCDRLALRNTLLFQWKNLRHTRHLTRHLLGLPARLALDAARAPWLPRGRRWAFARASYEAFRRWGQFRSTPHRTPGTIAREREFFRRFSPRRMAAAASDNLCRVAPVGPARIDGGDLNDTLVPVESQPAQRYPISRWYLRPAAGRLAAALTPTWVRPVHLTFCGLAAAAAAGAVLIWRPEAMPVAAALVATYWFFDRADGLLARRQQTVSAFGTWLDGNVDELADVGLHVATAAVLASQAAASWPWYLLIAFLGGKYLLMYGLTSEEHLGKRSPAGGKGAIRLSRIIGLFRRAYHLPGNADVRAHLLVLALAGGWLAAELAWVAIYYNLRWSVRWVLVARRLGGGG